MLSEKAEVFDFDASTKAAKAQLEKCTLFYLLLLVSFLSLHLKFLFSQICLAMGVLIQHMVNTKQTLPVLKNVSTSASKRTSLMFIFFSLYILFCSI